MHVNVLSLLLQSFRCLSLLQVVHLVMLWTLLLEEREDDAEEHQMVEMMGFWVISGLELIK